MKDYEVSILKNFIKTLEIRPNKEAQKIEGIKGICLELCSTIKDKDLTEWTKRQCKYQRRVHNRNKLHKNK